MDGKPRLMRCLPHVDKREPTARHISSARARTMGLCRERRRRPCGELLDHEAAHIAACEGLARSSCAASLTEQENSSDFFSSESRSRTLRFGFFRAVWVYRATAWTRSFRHVNRSSPLRGPIGKKRKHRSRAFPIVAAFASGAAARGILLEYFRPGISNEAVSIRHHDF